jgi:hypothetical protein
MYKVVQIWPGLFVCKQVTVCPSHIWTTLYFSGIKQAQHQARLYMNNTAEHEALYQAQVLGSILERCSICICQLWPLLYNPVGIFPWVLLIICKSLHEKNFNPIIWLQFCRLHQEFNSGVKRCASRNFSIHHSTTNCEVFILHITGVIAKILLAKIPVMLIETSKNYKCTRIFYFPIPLLTFLQSYGSSYQMLPLLSIILEASGFRTTKLCEVGKVSSPLETKFLLRN